MSNDVEKIYDERYVRWAATSRNQLSFLNNLLLTLSIVFLTLIFKDKNYSTYFTLKNPNLDLTLSVLSLIAVLISIVFGFITALNRLWDFRITSRITLIRKRMNKHSNTKKLDESSSDKYGFVQLLSMYWKLLMEIYPDISIEQCKAFDNISDYKKERSMDKFKELRTISYNLGLKTWRNLKIQMVTFIISIFLFGLSIIL